MQNSDRSAWCALSFCGAAVTLAGCGETRSIVPQTDVGALPITLQRQISELVQPTNGSSFSGGYSGTFASKGACTQNSNEKTTFDATGKASFLGSSREHGKLVQVYSVFCLPQGDFTLKSSRNPKDSIHFYVSEQASGTIGYTVTGGTGKFAKAQGKGMWSYTTGSSYTYSDIWTGTLTF